MRQMRKIVCSCLLVVTVLLVAILCYTRTWNPLQHEGLHKSLVLKLRSSALLEVQYTHAVNLGTQKIDLQMRREYKIHAQRELELPQVQTHPMTHAKRLSSLGNISTSNNYIWRVSNEGHISIVSAYFDHRPPQPSSVFLLGLRNHTQTSEKLYCVFQYSNSSIGCSGQPGRQKWLNAPDEKPGKDRWAFSLSCNVPISASPSAVSVAVSKEKKCAPPVTDWISISRPSEKSSNIVNFGVCIETPIYGKLGRSLNSLIEGIERNLAFGAEWLTVYIQDSNTVVMNALRDYEKQGVLEVIDWNLSHQDISNTHYYAESVSINDCLYRNMYKVRYLAFTDLDEIIVPQKNNNWKEMFAAVNDRKVSAFLFNHASFIRKKRMNTRQLSLLSNWTCDGGVRITNYPLPLYTLYNHRTPPYPYYNNQRTLRRKVIVKPLLIRTMGIHTSHIKLNGSTQIVVPSELGLLSHYRDPFLCNQCLNHLQQDNLISQLLPNLFNKIRNKLCYYI